MPTPAPFNRRNFLAGASMATAALALGPAGRAAAATPPDRAPLDAAGGVDLHWLDGAPAAATGAT